MLRSFFVRFARNSPPPPEICHPSKAKLAQSSPKLTPATSKARVASGEAYGPMTEAHEKLNRHR